MIFSKPRPQLPGLTNMLSDQLDNSMTKRKQSPTNATNVATIRSEPTLAIRNQESDTDFEFTHTSSMKSDNVMVTKSQENSIRKLLRGLPFELREKVASTLNLRLHETEIIRKELSLNRAEVNKLRSVLHTSKLEYENLSKVNQALVLRNQTLEDVVAELKDSSNYHEKFLAKNRINIDQMAYTNRILVDSLDALKLSFTNQSNDSKTNQSADFNHISSKKSNFPVSNEGNSCKQVKSNSHHDHCPKLHEFYQMERLRESLIALTRDHHKRSRQVETMQSRIEELKGNLRNAEQRNRVMKSEIEGLGFQRQNNLYTPNPNSKEVRLQPLFQSNNEDNIEAMLKSQVIDSAEGIVVLKNILAHISKSPKSLDLTETAKHFVSKEIARLFDTESMILFLLSPNSDKTLLKYTKQAKDATVVELNDDVNAFALEVIHTNNVSRLNFSGTARPNFDVEIDGIPGIMVRRILSVPVYDTTRRRAIGAIHFINKSQHANATNEGDMVFALIYAEQIANVIITCHMYQRMATKANLLGRILEASTDIYAFLPEDASSPHFTKDITKGDLLYSLETIIRSVIRCSQCRAFLCSEALGEEPNHLVLIDRNNRSMKSRSNLKLATYAMPTMTVGTYSGIASSCVNSGQLIHLSDPNEILAANNALVDLDSGALSLTTVPILDMQGKAIGCFQVVPGINSPSDHIDDEMVIDVNTHRGVFNSDNDSNFITDRISMQQAAQWLAHQLTPPLLNLLKHIGTPFQRPAKTPKSLRNFSVMPRSQRSYRGLRSRAETAEGDFEVITDDSKCLDDLVDNTKPRSSSRRMSNIGTSIVRSLQTLKSLLESGAFDRDQHFDSNMPSPSPSQRILNDALEVAENTEARMNTLKADLNVALQEVASKKAELENAIASHALTVEKLEEKIAQLESASHKERISSGMGSKHRRKSVTSDQIRSSSPRRLQSNSPSDSERPRSRSKSINAVTSGGYYSARAHSPPTRLPTRGTPASPVREDEHIRHVVEMTTESVTAELEAKFADVEHTLRRDFSHELTTLKVSLESKEQSLQEKEREIELLKRDIEAQDKEERVLNQMMADVNKQLELMQAEKQHLLEEKNSLRSEVQEMKEKNSQQQSIIAILQDQVVKLANQNMKDIDAATLKAMTTNNISSEAIAKEIKRDIRPDMDLGPAKDMLSSSLSFRKLSTVAEEDEDSLGSRKQSRIANDNNKTEASVAAIIGEVLQFTENKVDSKQQLSAEELEDQMILQELETDVELKKPTTAEAESRTSSKGGRRSAPPPSTPPPASRPMSRKPSDLQGQFRSLTREQEDIKTNTLPDKSDKVVRSSDWVEATDDFGTPYYYNTVTGESSWTLPTQAETTGEGINAAFSAEGEMVGDWLRHEDEYGREYWVNQITGQSEWEIPAEEAPGDMLSHRSGSSSNVSATAGGYTIEL